MNRIVEETLGSAQDGDGTLLFSLTALFFMACIWVLFIYLEKMLSGWLGLQISRRIRQDVTEKLMRLRYDFFMEQEAGGFLTRLNDDVRDAADYLQKLLSTVLSNGIVILILSVYLCTVNWILFLFSILWIPIVTLIFRSFLKSIAALSRERKQQQDRLTGLIREAFACTETEKSFLLQERNLKKLNKGQYGRTAAYGTSVRSRRNLGRKSGVPFRKRACDFLPQGFLFLSPFRSRSETDLL